MRLIDTPRKTFWAALATFIAFGTLWALANPLMASADEPAHVIKAVAVVHGARDVSGEAGTTGIGTVELPGVWAQLRGYEECMRFNPAQNASCQPSLAGDLSEPARVSTSAYTYNPMYYAVVGLPSLLPGAGEHTVYLMRIVSVAFAGVVFAMAARTVTELRERRWLGLGLLLAFVPTTLGLVSNVQPQSVEITGSVLLWVALLALLREPDAALTRRRLARVVVAAALIANTRATGPFFVTLIVGICLLAVPWQNVVRMFRERAVWWGLGGGVLATAIGAGWILAGGVAENPPFYGQWGVGIGFREAAMLTVDRTSYYLRMAFAALGWIDVPFPEWIFLAGAATLGLVAILALCLGNRRDRLVLAGTAFLIWFVPVVVQGIQARTTGIFWQGRYMAPVIVGFFILACSVIASRGRDLPERLQRNLVLAAAGSLAVINVVAFLANLHRYVNGSNGPRLSLAENAWLPPVPLLVLIAGFIGSYAAFTWVILCATADDRAASREA